LDAAVPSAERIKDLRYRIDLTSLPPSAALFAVGGI
jgi:hypothetical protein